jgi:Rab GDP dissociation inhibitor
MLFADIYIACVSSSHQICAKDYWVAIVSTIVETSVPENELQSAFTLLGPIREKCALVTAIDI